MEIQYLYLKVIFFFSIFFFFLIFFFFFFIRSKVVSCFDFIESFYNSMTFIGSFNSTECVFSPYTQEWLSDPCCNPYFKRNSTGCCVKRNVSKPISSFTQVSAETKSMCYTPSKSKVILQEFMELSNNFYNNPNISMFIFINLLLFFYLFFLFIFLLFLFSFFKFINISIFFFFILACKKNAEIYNDKKYLDKLNQSFVDCFFQVEYSSSDKVCVSDSDCPCSNWYFYFYFYSHSNFHLFYKIVTLTKVIALCAHFQINRMPLLTVLKVHCLQRLSLFWEVFGKKNFLIFFKFFLI